MPAPDATTILACPRCEVAVRQYPDASFGCGGCGLKFPSLAGVPLISTYVTHQELAHLTKLMRIQTLEREGPKDAMEMLQSAFAQAGQPLDEARAMADAIVAGQGEGERFRQGLGR